MPSTWSGSSLKQLGSVCYRKSIHAVNSFCPTPYTDWIFNKFYDIEFTSSHLCMLSRWLNEEVIAAIPQFPSIPLEVTPKRWFPRAKCSGSGVYLCPSNGLSEGCNLLKRAKSTAARRESSSPAQSCLPAAHALSQHRQISQGENSKSLTPSEPHTGI